MIWGVLVFLLIGLLYLDYCEKHPTDQHTIEVDDILRRERHRNLETVHVKKYRYTTAGIFEEGENGNMVSDQN